MINQYSWVEWNLARIFQIPQRNMSHYEFMLHDIYIAFYSMRQQKL